MPTDLNTIPRLPGVYLMHDSKGDIVYIGKAKDLHHRVRSYFANPKDVRVVTLMFNTVRSVDYIVCGSEQESEVLEQRLINRLKPAYNVLLRDDKSFPYIEVTTREPFPRVRTMRTVHAGRKDRKNQYFGPYPDAREVKMVVRWLTKHFKLVRCKYDTSMFPAQDDHWRAKHSACMYYQTGACSAPCLGKVSREGYRGIIKDIILFLGGHYKHLQQLLAQQLQVHTQAQEYEQAIVVRDISRYLAAMFSKFIFNQVREEDIVTEAISRTDALSALRDKLGLKVVPSVIEAMDISNLSGAYAVGSVVRFTNGLPDKREYRKYRIKTVSGIDDFRMMQEIATRRYLRLVRERKPLPNLVLIDGGKGQLAAAFNALRALKLDHKLEVVALAKQAEEVFKPYEDAPIRLTGATGDNILRHARDEAHRFAISYHKVLRRKGFLE